MADQTEQTSSPDSKNAPAAGPSQTVQDLKGKRVMTGGAGDITNLWWIAMAKANGLDPEKDVDLMFSGATSARLAALAAGSAHSAQLDQHAGKLVASAAGFGEQFGEFLPRPVDVATNGIAVIAIVGNDRDADRRAFVDGLQHIGPLQGIALVNVDGLDDAAAWHRHAGWDQHNNLFTQLEEQCRDTEGPSAALVTDLKERGLLDDTLVAWGGEFGRMPVSQGNDGRDHHNRSFSLASSS